MKTGALLDSLRCGLHEALDFAVASGADGVQFYASRGELTPWNSSRDQRVVFVEGLKTLDLGLAALCGDLGGHGFERVEEHRERIRKTCEIIDFGLELGTTVVSTHIGVIPDDRDDPIYGALLAALSELGRFAEGRGATIAIETGPEPATRLARFIEECGSPGVGVNFDPANLLMVQGSDPVLDFRALAPFVVHVHAKDGLMKKPCDPKRLYDAFAEDDFSSIDANDYFDERPLGQGAVDFPALIRTMEELGYRGYLTVERESGDRRKEDIAGALSLLRGLLK